jgi:hypothetical protein
VVACLILVTTGKHCRHPSTVGVAPVKASQIAVLLPAVAAPDKLKHWHRTVRTTIHLK